MLVVGPKDEDNGTVSIRGIHDPKNQEVLSVSKAIEKFTAEVEQKTVRQSFKNTVSMEGDGASNEY